MIIKNASGKYFELKEKVMIAVISSAKCILLAVFVPVIAKVLGINIA